jgi:hypothetical protein
MLGVTAFGLIFTPAFYTLVRRMGVARHGSPARLNSSGLEHQAQRL